MFLLRSDFQFVYFDKMKSTCEVGQNCNLVSFETLDLGLPWEAHECVKEESNGINVHQIYEDVVKFYMYRIYSLICV